MAKGYSTWHGGEKGERMRVERVNREGTGENEDVGEGMCRVGRKEAGDSCFFAFFPCS